MEEPEFWLLMEVHVIAKTRESDLFADVVCLEIPETYRGIRFDPLMLPSSMGPAYRAYMGDLYSQITSLRYKCKIH